jgi:Mg-chelatase subunit ChlD
MPVIAHADVVLLIDTSASMAGTKLTAAKVAATMFLAYLDFPRDRAAVIGFDGTARLVRGLTDDADALERAILALGNGSGTRIDLGLSAALSELRSARRAPANRGVVVLLSDGDHIGDRADVLDVAADLRALDALVYAIGLGEDADGELLSAVAGAPGRYFYAPDERALAEIYRSIAVTIPCGR